MSLIELDAIVLMILDPVDNDLEQTYESVKESVHKIGDYVDIFLIHTPSSGPEGRKIMWQALERLKKEGLAKDIGVSNLYRVSFRMIIETWNWLSYSGVRHIKQLAEFSSVTPVCNQIELHPFCQQREIVDYCKQQGIVNTAYCPIVRNQRSDDKTLVEVAKAHDKPVTQILLKWSIQKGFAPLIKSDNEERIKSNMELDGWELTDEEMKSIDKLDEGAGGAIAPNPVSWLFSLFEDPFG